jgi:NTP pyrophosphatase (non-canonical NTP hydrolase)
MEMNDYQRSAMMTKQRTKEYNQNTMVSLLGLAGEAGGLISEYKKLLRDGDAYHLFTDRVREELGDVLWYVASVADQFDLDLDEVASYNLSKCGERWGQNGSDGPASFDSTCLKKERFPRRFSVKLETVIEDKKAKLRMLMDNKPLGDSLTDNAYEDDGYRFHDVFHLGCTAILGWSPVTRKLLGCKRKSKPNIDEVEDGGRATAIEEGISAMIFAYASDHSFLKGVERIDYDLIRTIKGMTKNLEVQVRTYRDWEKTILTTYDVWREIREHNGGTVALDLDARSFRVQ